MKYSVCVSPLYQRDDPSKPQAWRFRKGSLVHSEDFYHLIIVTIFHLATMTKWKLNRNVDNVIKVIDKLNKIAAKMQEFEKHIFFTISPLNYISWICSIHALCDFRRRWKLPQNANLWKNPLKCGRKMTFCPAPVAHMFPIFHFMGLKYSHFKGFTYFVYLMRRHINICKEFH